MLLSTTECAETCYSGDRKLEPPGDLVRPGAVGMDGAAGQASLPPPQHLHLMPAQTSGALCGF